MVLWALNENEGGRAAKTSGGAASGETGGRFLEFLLPIPLAASQGSNKVELVISTSRGVRDTCEISLADRQAFVLALCKRNITRVVRRLSIALCKTQIFVDKLAFIILQHLDAYYFSIFHNWCDLNDYSVMNTI